MAPGKQTGRTTHQFLAFSNKKKPNKTIQLLTAATWRRMEQRMLGRAGWRAVAPVNGPPRELEGPAPSYRASGGRGEFVGGEGESFIAEVSVEHFLEDDAAVGETAKRLQ